MMDLSPKVIAAFCFGFGGTIMLYFGFEAWSDVQLLKKANALQAQLVVNQTQQLRILQRIAEHQDAIINQTTKRKKR